MNIENEIKRIERRIKFNLRRMREQVRLIKMRAPKVEALIDCDEGQMRIGAVVHMNLINRASESYNQMYQEVGELRVRLSHLRLELEAA